MWRKQLDRGQQWRHKWITRLHWCCEQHLQWTSELWVKLLMHSVMINKESQRNVCLVSTEAWVLIGLAALIGFCLLLLLCILWCWCCGCCYSCFGTGSGIGCCTGFCSCCKRLNNIYSLHLQNILKKIYRNYNYSLHVFRRSRSKTSHDQETQTFYDIGTEYDADEHATWAKI